MKSAFFSEMLVSMNKNDFLCTRNNRMKFIYKHY